LGGGESRSRKKIRRRNWHVGSTPISGTTSSNNNNPSAAGALPFQISERKFSSRRTPLWAAIAPAAQFNPWDAQSRMISYAPIV
jgi:hypothetical protein